VVTSRATDDNLIDDQDPQPSDIMASPRQPTDQAPGQPTPARSDSDKSASARTGSPEDAASGGTAGGGVSPNGAPAGGRQDAPAGDATVVDGIPALPADTIGASRSSRPKEPDANQAIVYPGESAVKSAGDNSAGRVPSGTAPSGTPPASGPASWAGSAALGDSAAPAGGRPAPAEPPAVSPPAFTWDVPDPPPHSRPSPARTFLRSGTTGKNPSAPQAGTPGGLGKPTTGENPGAARGAAAQKASGTQPKRTARQAHLTVARVEPWSVMKFSFVVSLVAFVIMFVAVTVLYGALAGLGVFDSLQRVVSDVTSSQGSPGVNAKVWFNASRILGYTALLGSLNIVLITAMSTIGAVVYNLTSRLVGGVEVTLKETE
jgi:hypothetical protein